MKQRKEYIVIYSTFPDLKTAKKIVSGLIKAKLAACGNIFKLSSIYVWKDKIEKASEYGVFIKTTKRNYKRCEDFIKNSHPYEVPEIISWTIERGLKEYLGWIDTETGKI